MADIDFASYGLEPAQPTVDFEAYGLEPVKAGKSMPSAVKQLAAKAEQQKYVEQPRTLQMPEEFSNPTEQPGFANLPKQEQLQRIGFSQFDPANQTPVGTMLPPGTYEQPTTRMAASIAPTLMAPEFNFGRGLIGRYLAEPLANALSRVGAGTAGNVAYAAPEMNSVQDLKDLVKRSVTSNAMLEIPTLGFRAPSYGAEMMNPVGYAQRKAQQIQGEAAGTQAVMQHMYDPVFQQYGNARVTSNPTNYLNNLGVTRGDLYPDAKITFDRFMQDPSFQNLHDLQSKIGQDYARIADNPNLEEKAQLFRNMREDIRGGQRGFLGRRSQNALNQYDLATQYARNHHYPYMPYVENPEALVKAVGKPSQKGIQREVIPGERDEIPVGHPMHQHLNELNRMADFGQLMKIGLPIGGSAAIGHALMPNGVGGILGGVAGLGIKQLTDPSIAAIQNPLLERLFQVTAPAYYGAGRVGIANRENQ